MPKRVVLVEPKYARFDFDHLPHGLLSIAAYLRDAGFEVSVHRSAPIPQADVVGVSATTFQYVDALNIARTTIAKTFVIGGSHATVAPGHALAGCLFDYAVIGDGEDAFVRLCNGTSPERIPGVVYRKNGIIMSSPNVPFEFKVRDGGLLIPAYDLLDGEVGEYVDVCRNREWVWDFGWKRKNRPKYWDTFRVEIGILKSLGVHAAHVADENFGCWHMNISSTIKALNSLEWWTCRSGVRNFLDGNLAKLLANSRCRGIELIVVTANDRLLGEFCDHTLEEAELAINLAEGIGLEVTVCATLGLPGETVDSMVGTWQWLRGKKVRIEVLSPLPGTEFYEEPERFSRFGYSVTIGEFRELDPCGNTVPWSMNTISQREFLDISSKMRNELGGSNVFSK